MMISFTCDYTEGAHPAILKRLEETNFIQEQGYGEDRFCQEAKALIREATHYPQADVFFLVGGTQTNATVIDALLRGYEGVIAAETGHVAVHEAGAIEFGGHKVLTLPQQEGKIRAEALKAYLDTYRADGSREHMVHPGMVYLSFPTEYGTLYTRQELSDIRDVCQEYGLPLFIDGARLGYGLSADGVDIDLPGLARLCDVFYIGGTKVGALCGEAVVFPRGDAPKGFFTIVKQHGALLAKGRLLGIQFSELMRDGRYLRIARHAIEQAKKLKTIFLRKGIPFHIDSPTNQQFPILNDAQMDLFRSHDVLFEVWERLPDGRSVTRFATSWATSDAQLEELETIVNQLPTC